MTANNSHAQVLAADSHEPKAHVSTHASGGSDPITGAIAPTTIELGHASDTTLARVSAGVVSIEGTNIVKAGAATSSGLTMATSRLLGRTTGSTGAIEEISVGTGLSLSAGSLSATGSGGSTPLLRLDYNLAADLSGSAVTFGTFLDCFSNQNFTVGSATSLIEVIVRGYGFFNDTNNQQYLARINVDSAGTPVLKYFGASNTAATNSRQNVFAGGSPVYLSGLSAATHTIKIQVTSTAVNATFFCRASTNGPTTGSEFLNVQVIEHP